jgi:hypothetical protein
MSRTSVAQISILSSEMTNKLFFKLAWTVSVTHSHAIAYGQARCLSLRESLALAALRRDRRSVLAELSRRRQLPRHNNIFVICQLDYVFIGGWSVNINSGRSLP